MNKSDRQAMLKNIKLNMKDVENSFNSKELFLALDYTRLVESVRIARMLGVDLSEITTELMLIQQEFVARHGGVL